MTTDEPTPQSHGPQSGADSLPPSLALYRLAVGHYISRALALAAKLDLADHLSEGARTAAALAAKTHTDPAALRRVLRLLASVGVVAEDGDGAFSLAALGELLRSDAPDSMKDMVSVFAGESIQDSWKELEFCVRTGLPAFKKRDPDADAFDGFRNDPELEAIFDRAMATFTKQTAVAVGAAYDFGAFGTVVDVGGGNGALLIGILRQYPQLRGIVFDQPAVAERARKEAESAQLSERLDAVGGSFFEAIPSHADAYLLKHVIHDWNDEQATAILRRCREAMGEGSKLLLVEGLYPDRIDTSLACRGAAANDVNMLVSTGGRQRSQAEFGALYRAAGFELTRIVPTLSPVCVIEGEPRR